MMQKFLITQIGPLPFQTSIQDQDARHIYKVLRLSPDDMVSVTDGQGTDYTAVILKASASSIDIEVKQALPSLTESPLELTLCCAMLKDKKMDLVIKHATQLGIYRWLPFFCERSVPTPSSKRMKTRHQRWETISKESLKQCRRSRVVDISMPTSFNDLLSISDDYDLKIAFWEKEKQALANLKPDKTIKKAIILIGPEGGFTKAEIQTAMEHDFLSYSLGPRILRAETAAISSCTLIQHLLGDI